MTEIDQLKRDIDSEVEHFFANYAPSEACLVLDSTGMATTKQYLVLAAIGLERLWQFKEVHAFSGGAFAYFGFHGLLRGHTNHSLEMLGSKKSEIIIRRFHHRNVLGPFKAVGSLLWHKTAFGSSSPITESLNFIFSNEHLEKRLTDFPPNITIYLGVKGSDSPIAVSSGNLSQLEVSGYHFRDLSIRELVTLASKVPYVYGSTDHGDEFFDAAFTPGYRRILRSLTKSDCPTLISTPWRETKRGKTTYLNCTGQKNYKTQMTIDFARLMLNLPNRDWSGDFNAAFL